MKPDTTLNVTLKVDEENVTGETIPVTVEKVTKIDDGSDVTTEGLKYYWYIKGMDENEADNSYTFDGLDKEKSYTLGCKIVSETGDSGTSEVTVISFGVQDPGGSQTVYFRATKGMTWLTWKDSSYNSLWPGKYEDSILTPVYGSGDRRYGWVVYEDYPEMGDLTTGFNVLAGDVQAEIIQEKVYETDYEEVNE